MEILKAFQALNSQATIADIIDACRRLFVESDESRHASRHAFAQSEIDAIATLIYEYVRDPRASADREVVFKMSRPLEGASMDYYEYARIFSEDMLYQNYLKSWSSTFAELDDLRRALQTFLLGILFRYQFCVDEDAAFPIPMLLNYMEGVKVLFAQEQREEEVNNVLWTTLKVLGSLENLNRSDEVVPTSDRP